MEKKTWGKVFDTPTLFTMQALYHKGIFAEIGGEISSGKEARVFVGYNDELIALKIYRVEAAVFENIWPYIKGDPRFWNIGKNRRRVIYSWVKKEFRNLSRLFGAGVRAPRPLAFRNNVLAMSFIGDERPAPLLKDTGPSSELFEDLVQNLVKAYQIAKVVHGDLSEYNVMVKDNKTYLIDVAQAVDIRHPKSDEFLERDVANIHKFFAGTATLSKKELMQVIKGEGEDRHGNSG